MIRNVILHLHSEQPLKADIESLPTAADAGLLCTNLRTIEGRKPMSTEYLDSVFLIPYNVIRFIEIPRESIGAAGISPHRPGAVQLPAEAAGAPEGQPVIILGSGAAPAAQEPDEERLEHLEPDAELLRRIREA